MKEKEKKEDERKKEEIRSETILSHLDEIHQLVNSCYEKVQTDIFSREIDELFSEIEKKLEGLRPEISEFINLVNSGSVPYDEINSVAVKLADVESSFEKLVNFLRNLSESDSKRIEHLLRVEAQIKSSVALKSKGRVVRKKL